MVCMAEGLLSTTKDLFNIIDVQNLGMVLSKLVSSFSCDSVSNLSGTLDTVHKQVM